ncbi:hypothetical protein M408DRAFT_328876 [Serendipita vermifera MAFF 305830]|uniref:Uncharacterized protein n=1 Tax=Serendipita vermifera MAFF 305830 TaxID=933852 RepID=A0A0C2XJE8_SERVB|nr:hypothetical protein M408DRAFT_328876 [Serendipita vermifera MAFF 305830]
MADNTLTNLQGTPTLTRPVDPRPGQSTSSVECATSTHNGTVTCQSPAHTSRQPDENMIDFASTALWAVIVSTIVAALLLGALLFWTRRRKRMRTSRRIRALLWEIVRGVQDGSVEPVVLERLVYGPEGPTDTLRPPKIFETSISEGEKGVKQPTSHSVEGAWKWDEILPISLAPRSIPITPPPASPRPSLFQWPWRPPHAVPPTDCSKDKETTNSERNPFTFCIERRVDAAIVIVMPHVGQPGTTSNAPPLLVNCSIALASASPSFQDNIIDPAIPPSSQTSNLLTGAGDGFSPPLTGVNWATVLSYPTVERPANYSTRHDTRIQGPNPTYSQWVARRGLNGGTPAG